MVTDIMVTDIMVTDIMVTDPTPPCGHPSP